MLSLAVRTVVTCAVAFGLMTIVGNAARETDASADAGMAGPVVEFALPMLWQANVTPEAPALPELQPASETAPDVVIPVDIKGFIYSPDPVTVPAGASIAWTNLDNAPHTSTGIGDAISALDSGAIVFGQTFTQQFDTPGCILTIASTIPTCWARSSSPHSANTFGERRCHSLLRCSCRCSP